MQAVLLHHEAVWHQLGLDLIIFQNERCPSFRNVLGQTWKSEISAILPQKTWLFLYIQLWPWILFLNGVKHAWCEEKTSSLTES